MGLGRFAEKLEEEIIEIELELKVAETAKMTVCHRLWV